MKIPISVHERNLRQLRCCISDTDQDIELHHTHGASMLGIGVHKGLSLKTNPFLQIPLTFKYHRGEFDPEHIGMRTWEEKFGTQLGMLERVNDQLPYDVFVQAGWYDGQRLPIEPTGEH